jgi:hypothetical protein
VSDANAVSLPTVATRSQAILAAVVAFLVVAAGLLMAIVLGTNGAEAAAPMPEATPVVEVVEEDDEAHEAGPIESVSEVPVVTYEVFLSRDPFQPVVPEAEVVSGSAEGTPQSNEETILPTDPDGTAIPVIGTDGTPVPVVGTPEPGSETTCSGKEEVVCDGRVISLVDVVTANGERMAVVQVDTTVYEVARGQVFAGSFELRSIDGSCVSLLYGDNGFQLCPGETVLK